MKFTQHLAAPWGSIARDARAALRHLIAALLVALFAVSAAAANDAPVLTAGGTLAYTQVVTSIIDNTVTVVDPDSPNLTGATVQLTTNYQTGQDVLSFVTMGPISGTFVASTGTLTLTGTDTVAHYQAALRTVKYNNTSADPSTLARTVEWRATDGTNQSPAGVTSTITVTGAKTTVWLGGTGQWSVDANWSEGRPGPLDTARFDSNTALNSTVNTPFTIAHLDMTNSPGTYTGTLSVSSPLTITGSATTRSNVNVTASSAWKALTVVAGTTTVQSGAALTVTNNLAATGVLAVGGASSGMLSVGGALTLGGTLTVGATSSANLNGDVAAAGAGTRAINAAGALTLRGASVDLSAIDLTATGATTFAGGAQQALTLTGNDDFASVTINKTAGTTLTVGAGQALVVTGLTVTSGILDLNTGAGSASLTVNGPTNVQAAGVVRQLSNSAGVTHQFSGPVNIAGAFTFTTTPAQTGATLLFGFNPFNSSFVAATNRVNLTGAADVTFTGGGNTTASRIKLDRGTLGVGTNQWHLFRNGIPLNAATASIEVTNGFADAPTGPGAQSQINGNSTDWASFSCPTIALASLPNGTKGTVYTGATTASGGTGPYTYAVTSGSIPSGLTFNTGTGALTLSPSATGSFTFGITATDTATSCTGVQSYIVHIGSEVAPGDLVIREFRLRGPAGAEDEYIEIANRVPGALTIAATDGSGGFGVVSEAMGLLATIPNGTVIPAGGFYLAANTTPTTGYSLSNYGGALAASHDASWTTDLPDNTGIGLFKSTSTFVAGTVVDAVGFVGSSSPYLEGTGITVPGLTGTSEVVYARNAPGGVIQDTGSNASDFYLGDTNAASFPPVTARLAAPGPQNLASEKATGLTLTMADPMKSPTTFPNRYRVGITATTGVYYFRWKVTNNTGAAITKLRIRIATLTTQNSPGYTLAGTQADFRLVTSPDAAMSVPAPVTALGLTLEAPPTGLPLNGGDNASATATLPGGTLASGASVYINIGFKYEQAGSYVYFVSGEAK